jgi:glycosyltransferase involved in cell wall biosynthesis
VIGPVAFVLKGYPRLSETFIAQEILALERRGIELHLYSLRHPTDADVHPVHADIAAPVTYLPEYLYREPLRVWRGWRAARKCAGYEAAFRIWLRDVRRDPTPNRVRRFGQALVLCAELDPKHASIHAHFLHTPASVARYAARMRGLPWSCSAHAKDVWTTPDWEKAEKLADCRWAVTCTAANREHLDAFAPAGHGVELVYHGLDLKRFSPPPGQRPERNGRDHDDPVIVLSVGRAVAKKGYADLIDALALLPADLHWRFVHIGGGALLEGLRSRASGAGIAERVTWLGACPHETVLAHYRAADLFVLASRVAADGDRDGLPNVLMEAQSQSLACLSTWVAAIPELIEDERTGVLVPSGDPRALADGLRRLIGDAGLRARLGAAGMRRVRDDFTAEDWAERLAAKFAAHSRAA